MNKQKNRLMIECVQCHLMQPYWALNLCKNCYDKELKTKNEGYQQRQLKNSLDWRKERPGYNKVASRLAERKRSPEYKEQRRWKWLFKKYGITKSQYQSLLEQQNYQCAICGTKPKRSLHVDHCHKTGKIRGLLCFKCNYGFYWFSDSPERLRLAASYLEK